MRYRKILRLGHTFLPQESERKIRFEILVAALIAGCITLAILIIMRISQDARFYIIIDGIVGLILSFLLLLLFFDKKFYGIAVRLSLISLMIITVIGIYSTQVLLVRFSGYLAILLLVMMLIEKKERIYWYLIYFIPIVTLYFLREAGYLHDIPMENSELILFTIFSVITIMIVKGMESIILSSRAYQLEMANQRRNTLLAKMVSVIAHQWRQPLATINATIGNLHVARSLGEMDCNSVENSLKTLHPVVEELSDTISLFNDIFENKGERKPVNIAEFVTGAIDEYTLADPQTPIKFSNFSDNDTQVLLYAGELKRALFALLDNATEHSDRSRGDVPVEVSLRESGGSVLLEVSNYGLPIPEEDLERLFDPYFSTKNVNQGVGLGLFIAKAFVQKSGGAIEVENGPEQVRFTIILPAI